MGAQQSIDTDQEYIEYPFFERYEQQLGLHHNFKVFKHKDTDQRIILKEFYKMSEEDAFACLSEAKEKKNIRHPNLLSYIDTISREQKHLCSQNFKIQVIYEYEEFTLEQEINQRKKNNYFFVESQMLQMINGLVGALSLLEQNKISHSNISLSTIYLDKSGIVKIADPYVFNEPTLYAQIFLSQNQIQNLYLSPLLLEQQLYKEFENNKFSLSHNPYKSDVFSLGMCLLHTALLVTCDSCYNYQKRFINEQILDQKLAYMSTKYCKNISDIIRQMLVIDENDRFDFFQLRQVLIEQQNGKYVQNPIVEQDETVKKNAKKTKQYEQISKQHKGKNYKSLLEQEKDVKNISINEKPLIVKKDNKLTKERDDQGTFLQYLPSQILDIRNIPDDFGDHMIGKNQQDYRLDNRDINYLINKYRDINEVNRGTSNYQEMKLKFEPMPDLIRNYEIAGVKYEILGDPTQHKVSYQMPVEQNLRSTISKIDTSRYYPGISQYKSTYTPISGQRAQDNIKTSTQGYYIEESVQPANIQNSLYSGFKNENINLQYSNHAQDYNHVQDYSIPQILEKSIKYSRFSNHDQEDHIAAQKLEKSEYTNQRMISSQVRNYKDKENPDQQIIYEAYENGQQYQGQKLNNMRHGKGKLIYVEGGGYEGEWKFNSKNGKGVLFSADGEPVYTGQWLDDNFDGEGVLVNVNEVPINGKINHDSSDLNTYLKGNNWKKYMGGFRNDQKYGYGILELSNGDQFQGHFVNDQLNGEGIYITKNGRQTNGFWIDNKLKK